MKPFKTTLIIGYITSGLFIILFVLMGYLSDWKFSGDGATTHLKVE
jgi:hypothetical protein